MLQIQLYVENDQGVLEEVELSNGSSESQVDNRPSGAVENQEVKD